MASYQPTNSPLAAATHHHQHPQHIDASHNNQRNSSYFPQQPANAGTATPPLSYTDDDVRANTLANTHPNHLHNINSNNLAVPGLSYSNSGKFTEEWDASQRGSSILEGHTSNDMQRANSFSSNTGEDHLSLPSRGNTLKKKNSLRRNASLKRSGSRRSMKAGSVRSLALQSTSDPDEAHSAFHCPVPTTGNPTEVLATRFQSWRKILKDLITYYREIQNHYEAKSKSLLKLANVANNTPALPPGFLASGGLSDAMDILRAYHKNAITESNKAKEIEEDVILALTGLRSDLHQKIKEIKSLSGDFKNSVEKEMDSTRRAVKSLQDVLGQSDIDPASATGKQDPYLLRLAVDRQVERQIDEETYLHQAYLNLESSGRELESIVVGEIQKAYNAYAGILKRESDAAYNAIDELRIGPISMPKDREWANFVQKDNSFVDPDIAVRSAEQIHYPGQGHVSCQEIRAGLLERKSKYLKSYTAGWYVLSPTHLHEFKSADKAQAPIMSLYLPEQKLGSHSTEGGSSNKFILKGRQTGAMHRGHTWVFRAETHDTMMAWYEDIKALTEKTPQERSEFVRGHTRSLSQSSRRSMSSDGVVDEEDDEPFSADTVVDTGSKSDFRRPQPGGRFPSDIQVNAQRGLQAPLSPSSMSSGFENQDRDTAALGGFVAGSGLHNNNNHYTDNGNVDQAYGQPGAAGPQAAYGSTSRTDLYDAPTHAAMVTQQAKEDGVNPYTNQPVQRSASQASLLGRPDHRQHQGYEPVQNIVVPVEQMQRSQSRQSQRSTRSQNGQYDVKQRTAGAPPVIAPIMTDRQSQRTDSEYDDGVLETPGGNQQYGAWLNGSSGRQQSGLNGNANDGRAYYSSGARSTGDVNVVPMAVPGTNYGYQQQQQQDGTSGDASDGAHVMAAPGGGNYVATSRQSQVYEATSRGRPVSANIRTDSTPHVPGEYPKGNTPTAENFGKVA